MGGYLDIKSGGTSSLALPAKQYDRDIFAARQTRAPNRQVLGCN